MEKRQNWTQIAIDDLFRAATATAQATTSLLSMVQDLDARVKALEERGQHRAVASTATRDQTYSWQPGGWVDQYVAEVDA